LSSLASPTCWAAGASRHGVSRDAGYRSARGYGTVTNVDADEAKRKVDVAQLLLEAARQLGETLEPERVYERFHLLLADVVPHDGIVVSSYHEAESLIRCEYAWVDGNLVDPTTLPPLPLNREGGGMQSRVIVTGEPLLVNDVVQRTAETDGMYYNVDREGHGRKIPDLGPADTTAAMMAAVKHEQHVVGVVQLMRDSGHYTDDDFQLFQGLVGQMAAAVRNARLQQEQRRLAAAEAAARARADEREQAARVLDVVADGIFLVDQDGVVALWNRAAEAITGIAGAEARGRAITDVVPDWNHVADRISVGEAAALPPQTLPVNLNGRQLWLSFVAVRSPDGVVFAFRDVTGERRLDDEKRDLVATISHELRTPMAAVYGAARTLLRTDLDFRTDQARDLLEMIATQALRLTEITEELLFTARLDRGTVHLEHELIDLADLARATI